MGLGLKAQPQAATPQRPRFIPLQLEALPARGNGPPPSCRPHLRLCLSTGRNAPHAPFPGTQSIPASPSQWAPGAPTFPGRQAPLFYALTIITWCTMVGFTPAPLCRPHISWAQRFYFGGFTSSASKVPDITAGTPNTFTKLVGAGGTAALTVCFPLGRTVVTSPCRPSRRGAARHVPSSSWAGAFSHATEGCALEPALFLWEVFCSTVRTSLSALHCGMDHVSTHHQGQV